MEFFDDENPGELMVLIDKDVAKAAETLTGNLAAAFR
jgi:hypothetical protein